MCKVVSFTLICEHVVRETKYCKNARPSRSEPGVMRMCDEVRYVTEAWTSSKVVPPEATRSAPRMIGGRAILNDPKPPKCPVVDCPFERFGRHWICCWCMYLGNRSGKCIGTVHYNGYTAVQCGHVCCANCGPARDQHGQPTDPYQFARRNQL